MQPVMHPLYDPLYESVFIEQWSKAITDADDGRGTQQQIQKVFCYSFRRQYFSQFCLQHVYTVLIYQ
jgi:hypothetical protein